MMFGLTYVNRTDQVQTVLVEPTVGFGGMVGALSTGSKQRLRMPLRPPRELLPGLGTFQEPYPLEDGTSIGLNHFNAINVMNSTAAQNPSLHVPCGQLDIEFRHDPAMGPFV
ncbi:MAG: hypothetical protein R3F17_01180 [Planctomycetota bacterium]